VAVAYHIGFLNESNTTLSAWPVPVTTGTSVGDGIIVLISTVANVHTINSITDTQSNVYSLVTSDSSQPAWAYKAAAPIKQLTTSDTITVNWSATVSEAGCVGCIGVPGCNTVDNFNNADGVSNTATVSKTPVGVGDTSLYMANWNNTAAGTLSGGNPAYVAVANLGVTGLTTHIAGNTLASGAQAGSTAVTSTPSWSCIVVNMLANASGTIGMQVQRRAAYGQQ
jgi:hypothetical protein